MKKYSVTSICFGQKILFVVAFFLFLFLSAAAQAQNTGADTEPETLFEQANIAYTQDRYQQAIDLYLTIIHNNGVSASLFYNLANSYAAAGQTGSAVLNYERALRLAPGDSAVQANLDQVRKDAGLYQEGGPWYQRLAGMLGADQWLLLFACAFLLLSVSALTMNLTAGNKRRTGVFRLLLVGSPFVMLLTLPPALIRYQEWNVGVVLAEDARLLISPFKDAASAGGIRAGRLVRPISEHGEYVLVEDETGKSGWLVRNEFALVGRGLDE